jgi:response regulator NasT
MSRAIRIAVADSDSQMRAYYGRTLPSLGHRLIGGAETGRELIECCRRSRPDLIITDIKLPVLDGIKAISEIGRTDPIPAILVSAYHGRALIERVHGEPVLAYLIKPIKEADLEVAIRLTLLRFTELQTIRKEAEELRQTLADRKVIERAKLILMKRADLNEEGAFRRLWKLARDHNQKLADVSLSIVRAEEAFQSPGA